MDLSFAPYSRQSLTDSNSGHSMIFASVPETGEGTGESNIKYWYLILKNKNLRGFLEYNHEISRWLKK